MSLETSVTNLAEQFEILGSVHDRQSVSASNLPSPLLIYQSGNIMFTTRQVVLHNTNNEHLIAIYQRLSTAYDLIIQNLPYQYAMQLWSCLTDSFASLIRDKACQDYHVTLNKTISALCGCFIHSETACQQVFSTNICESLVSLYHDHLTMIQSHQNSEHRSVILCSLSHLIVHGFILPLRLKQNSEPDELFNLIMQTVSHLFGDYADSYCLGDLLAYQQEEKQQIHASITYMSHPFMTLVEAVKYILPLDSPQTDYIIQFIEMAPTSSYSTRRIQEEKQMDSSGSGINTNTLIPSIITEYSSSLDRNIDMIHSILPHLGRGYIEVALTCYQNNPEQTIAVLLESESDPSVLHPRIRNLDPQLPSKKQDNPILMYNNEDETARQIQKKRIQEMETQFEKEAYHLQLAMTNHRHDEYEDDYDDQYDDIGEDGGNVGGTDVGIYDVDLDAIRTYNRIARELEREGTFWNDMKNTNRFNSTVQQHDELPDEETEKRYSGPDKGKGGRIILQDGGRSIQERRTTPENKTSKSDSQKDVKSSEQTSQDMDMSKLDKRRKNTQKSHHHRKDKATRKATQGLIPSMSI